MWLAICINIVTSESVICLFIIAGFCSSGNICIVELYHEIYLENILVTYLNEVLRLIVCHVYSQQISASPDLKVVESSGTQITSQGIFLSFIQTGW